MKAARCLVLGAVAAVTLAGCGMPPAGTSATIPASQLPYGLERQSARTTAATPLPTLEQGPKVWLVHDEGLVPVAAPRAANQPAEPKALADAVIARLANGPNESDLAAGYRSALSPTATLQLLQVRDAVAEVELNVNDTGLGGAAQLPLAIGQIVLTLTSVDGVEAVQFRNRQAQVSVPLPTGVLTTRPVTESDYLPLVAAGRRPAAGAARPTP